MTSPNLNTIAARSWKRYPKYKPSGITWLEEVPEGWMEKKLKYLIKLESGQRESIEINNHERFALSIGGEHIGWYGELTLTNPRYISEKFYNQLRQGHIHQKDILFVKDGTIGKSAFIRQTPITPMAVSEHVFIIRPKGTEVTEEFLYYFLISVFAQEQILQLIRGAAQPGLNSNFSEFVFLTISPNTIEQHSITNFLEYETARIDALIIKKERQIKILQEQQAALISHVVTKGLDPNAMMKDSGIEWIGEVPEHWGIKKLKQLSYRISGRLVFKPAQYLADSGIPFLFGTNITEKGFSLEDVKYIPAEINERFKHHALRTDDLVMVRVGAPGLTAVVPKELEGLNCASMIIIRKSSDFNSEWLSFVLNSQIGKNQVDSVTYGAAQEQINVSDAINFLIPTPPLEEQKEIQNHLKELSANFHLTIAKINRSIAFLKEYRTALISAAVTGKTDVRQEVSA